MSKPNRYTCQEYREEMMLLGLCQRLKDPNLADDERRAIEKEIKNLENLMNLD